jgi:L-aspartate oxidase
MPNHKMIPWAGGTGETTPPGTGEADGDALRTLRATMSRHVGVVRDRAGLSDALGAIEALLSKVASPQARNACITAQLIAAAALVREESRGGHYRRDFPEQRPEFAMRSYSTIGRVSIGTAARSAA